MRPVELPCPLTLARQRGRSAGDPRAWALLEESSSCLAPEEPAWVPPCRVRCFRVPLARCQQREGALGCRTPPRALPALAALLWRGARPWPAGQRASCTDCRGRRAGERQAGEGQ